MEFWKGCGMSLSDDFPDKVYPGNAKATWMTADIAEVLDKLKGSRREACVIDCNAYVAVRCKMRKEVCREFQLCLIVAVDVAHPRDFKFRSLDPNESEGTV